jgi:hypothetical protein
MKKLLIKIWILGALAATSIAGTAAMWAPQLAAVPLAHAQVDLFPETAGNQLICRGDRDFGGFIAAALSFDDFSEYWKDIFVRYQTNICQYQDIDALLKQMNTVRTQIRKAFYVCADTSTLKKRYYELEAEVLYLRNYISTDYGSFYVVSDAKVLKKMKDYFYLEKGFMSDDQVNKVFEKLKSKYKTKIDTYKNCKDVTWQNLVDKWNEFKNDAGGISSAVKQASASIEKKWKRMKKVDLKLNRDFIGGFLDARINGLSPKEGIDQILAEFKKNDPSAGVTFNQLQAAQTKADSRYSDEATGATYLANYQALYLESTDAFVNDVKSHLTLLDAVITSTYPYENQTVQCVKSINNKQC